MRSLLARLLLPLALAPFLSAATPQDHLAIPAQAADSEAAARRWLAGGSRAMCQQVLVGAAHLGPIAGRELTGIALRRDTDDRTARGGGSVRLVLRVGAAARAPGSASRRFAENITAAVEVFAGTVQLPAAPAVAGYVGWIAPHVVEVPFAVPYRYAGGDLCVELRGEPIGSGAGWWPVDAVEDTVSGSTIVVGRSCGPFAGLAGQTAYVAPRALVPGETAVFVANGQPGANGFVLFGLEPRTTPIDLTAVGAPGCALWVDAFATVPTAFGPALAGSEFGGAAWLAVPLPSLPAFVAASFAVQWAEIGARLSTSNAIACHVAGRLPSLDLAIVEGPAGAGEGDVVVTEAPVLRFAHRE